MCTHLARATDPHRCARRHNPGVNTPTLSAADAQTEQRFQTLFDQAPFSAQRLAVDGRTLQVNRAWEDFWGTHAGDPLYEFVLSGHNMLSDPQLEAKGVTPYLRRAFAGEAVRIPAIHYDPVEIGQPGLARWVEAIARPITTPDGRVLEVMLIHEDVTERLLAERQLRASEAQFRTIADAMPQMVWSTLPDGYGDYFNQQACDFTGASPGTLNGESWADVVHPDDRQGAWGKWRHSLDTGDPYEVEYRLRHHSGEYRWCLGRALAVRDGEGGLVRWMGTCTDIHEQKRTRDELLASNRRKDDFLAMLAHELRNPLAPISAAAHLLKVASEDPATVQRSADVIERQVRHMTELVDDLLDVSRVTRGLVELVRQPVELKSVLADAIEQVRPLLESRGHELATRMPAGDVYVLGDRPRLVQVVSNLLNNAAKYTPVNGALSVAMVASEEVQIRVADNGTGIERELLPHVFELFTQGARTPDRAQGGLGLGLALVKSLVGLHGGAVTAHSAGNGQGSAFTVTLPLLEIVDPSKAPATDVTLLHLASRKLRVLIVDDNKDAAETLGMLLDILGHEVHLAHDGARALQLADDAAFDAYVLDIGLPGMDGYALAGRLRAHASGAGAMFIALTGYGSAGDKGRGHEAGFDHYLVKPADLNELAKLLQRASGNERGSAGSDG